MRVLITGICGYVGSQLARRFAESLVDAEICGLDNLSRRGSETNVGKLSANGVRVAHGDIRLASDVRALPDVDWVVDCAATPTVTAGVGGEASGTAGQLMEHNVVGTLNLLEFCRERGAGLVLLSTSRVYSIEALLGLPWRETETRFEIDRPVPEDVAGFSERGVSEEFSTRPPVSLYGASKLASELLALEYGIAFDLPVWINRCGVIGGPGQFGKIDQGIFSFWVYSCALGRPLSYIGFGGQGKQVRDCVAAEDIADLALRQMGDPGREAPRVVNVGGGMQGALSLVELTGICESHFEREIPIGSIEQTRPYDIPYYVTDATRAREAWEWRPSQSAEEIVAGLCRWTADHLELVRGFFE